MVTGVFNTTTTVLQDGQNFVIDLNITTTTENLTNFSTTTIRSSGGPGPSPSPTTSLLTTIQTTVTTTILQIDNDTIVIGNYTCVVNDTIDTEVWLFSSAYGAQFTLYYNNSLLEVLNVSNGTFFSDFGVETYWFNLTNSNSVLYAETSVNSTLDVMNNEVLARILFKCLVNGSTNLDLNDVKVVDYVEEYLNISVLNGFILIK